MLNDEVMNNRNDATWIDLPIEVLSAIIVLGGNTATFAQRMAQVCKCWREVLITQKSLLRDLIFRDVKTVGITGDFELPILLQGAVTSGNIGAQVLVARLLQRIGGVQSEKKHWLLAAKNGHPEAQWMVGSGYYYGKRSFERDSEQALFWLQKTIRSLTLICEGNSRDVASTPHVLPCLMTLVQCRSIYRKCCHIVGLMYLDGEAIRSDWSQSIRLLKTAELHGCEDAPKLLISMYRNGTY